MSFIANLEFPRVPFGIFIVVGSHFRGFHVRFTDIARGGIRLIKHREVKEYTDRKRQLFNENFNLAQAQLLKNKDIPEGGSKGTIFVEPAPEGHPRGEPAPHVPAVRGLAAGLDAAPQGRRPRQPEAGGDPVPRPR